MGDVVDKAAQYQAMEFEMRMRSLRSHMESTGPGQAECEDCEEEIPAGRRAAMPGCIRCVKCQEEFELEQGRQS